MINLYNYSFVRNLFNKKTFVKLESGEWIDYNLLEAREELGGAFRPLARFGVNHKAVKKVILAFRDAQLSSANRGGSETTLCGGGIPCG